MIIFIKIDILLNILIILIVFNIKILNISILFFYKIVLKFYIWIYKIVILSQLYNIVDIECYTNISNINLLIYIFIILK